MGTVRYWLRIGGIALGMIVGVPLHYFCRIFRIPSPWPRMFLGWVGWVAGARIVQEGTYDRRNTLFVANHATWLDIMIIGGTTGAAFVAKEELKQSWFVGWLASLNDSVWVQRADRRGIGGQVDQIRKVLETGRSVCFFPEATTKGGKEVLPFRASLFSTLYPPIEDYQVQPIAIDYGTKHDLVAWGDDDTGSALTKRILRAKGTIPVKMVFLPKLDPAAMDRKQMAATSRQMIVDTLDRLDGRAPVLHPNDASIAAA